jgi:hypothetical protein
MTIPADLLELLAESLMGIAMRGVAGELEQCGTDPDAYPAVLARFDAVREALDTLNWGDATTGVDMGAHRQVVASTLTTRLAGEREIQADAESTPDNPDAERQRQRAYGYILQIERFMAEAGL